MFERRRRHRLGGPLRRWVAALVVLAVAAAALAVAALLAWPKAGLAPSDAALARVTLSRFAGRIASVDVRGAGGVAIPVELRHRQVWPTRPVQAGERLTVEVTVRRPGWAAWLVGRTERRTFVVGTPAARLRGRWLQVAPGAPVRIAFDTPVSVVAFGRRAPRRLEVPSAVVPVGVVARGAHAAGSVEVTAAARVWERLPPRVRVSWFPALPYPQLLASPRVGGPTTPIRRLTLTFSSPVADAIGTRRPRLTPRTPGRWRLLDAHTLAFQPSGFGFGLGSTVRVVLPRRVHVAGSAEARLTRTIVWHVPQGSTLRLQQLLAQLGYLPVGWRPGEDDPQTTSVRSEIAAAISPPPGRFDWRYPNTPPELRTQWRAGEANTITRGAVMMFEDTHGLAVDGLVGPVVWRALIADVVAGRRRTEGYSYVFVHRSVPQSLNLWHDGRVILSSPGNTGVPAAPTQLGTFTVFEHIPVGTMSGTNPDGTHYNDPGIRYISYFNGGDAIHAFNRSSYGTPQSLGCVELPLDAAAKVWPYTPIGTLVTVEN
jgi:peptidoglycan hydrolase-like protein with peptidoglycan-binding domain